MGQPPATLHAPPGNAGSSAVGCALVRVTDVAVRRRDLVETPMCSVVGSRTSSGGGYYELQCPPARFFFRRLCFDRDITRYNRRRTRSYLSSLAPDLRPDINGRLAKPVGHFPMCCKPGGAANWIVAGCSLVKTDLPSSTPTQLCAHGGGLPAHASDARGAGQPAGRRSRSVPTSGRRPLPSPSPPSHGRRVPAASAAPAYPFFRCVLSCRCLTSPAVRVAHRHPAPLSAPTRFGRARAPRGNRHCRVPAQSLRCARPTLPNPFLAPFFFLPPTCRPSCLSFAPPPRLPLSVAVFLFHRPPPFLLVQSFLPHLLPSRIPTPRVLPSLCSRWGDTGEGSG